MAGVVGDYLKHRFLNMSLRDIPIYVALFNGDPGDLGIAGEVSGLGYARQQVTFAEPVYNDSLLVCLNSNQVAFPRAGNSWGTVSHFAIFDAPAGGNLYYHNQVLQPKTVEVGDLYIFFIGDIEVAI